MLEIEELAPGIVSYLNVIEDPKSFIADIESLVEIEQLSWNFSTSRKSRDCGVISLPKFDTLTPNEIEESVGGPPSYASIAIHNFLNSALYSAIDHYRDTYTASQWRTSEGWQILKYGEDGHFVNHFDDSTMYPRTVSMSFYLNNDYQGGEIEFNKFGLKIKPQANQMIMFPSNYVYTHTIHPVLSGTRYAIVSWWN